MSTHLGTTPLKISSETGFDPAHGFQTHETYSGPLTSLSTLKATLILLGVRTSLSQRAGRCYLEAWYALADSARHGGGGVHAGILWLASVTASTILA